MDLYRKPFVAGALLAAMLVAAPAHAQWHQLDTPSFRIISAAGNRRTQEIARDLEVYQASIATILPKLDTTFRIPVTVFVLDSGSWRRYVPDWRGKGGIVYPYPSRIHVMVNASSWKEAAPNLYHELTHIVLHQNANGRQLPLWYDEGYAEFLSTIRIEGDKVRVGGVPFWRWLALLELPRMPLDTILNASRESPEYRREPLVAAFYSGSWLIIHYSTFEKPQRAEQIESYLGLVSAGIRPTQAFAQAFPEDGGAFERELTAYAASRGFKYATLSLPEWNRAPGTPRQISRSEALTAIADWKLASGQATDPDLTLFRKWSEKSAADSVQALQLGALHANRSEYESAFEAAQNGCDSQRASFEVAMLCGDIHRVAAQGADKSVFTKEQRKAFALTAREYYDLALRHQPDNLEALLSAAQTTAIAPKQSEAVRAGLERAWQRRIHEAEIAYWIARLYRSSDLRKAKEYLELSLLYAEDFKVQRTVLAELNDVESRIAASAAAAEGK